ncbi:MAG: peptidoglycan DD-metalloendopeptidase family protein [Pseudomonadota bacterium]
MPVQRKTASRTRSIVLLGSTGVALALGFALTFASQSAETSQPLPIAALQDASAGNGRFSPMPDAPLAGTEAAGSPVHFRAVTSGGHQKVAFVPAPDTDGMHQSPAANDEVPTSYETFDLDDEPAVAEPMPSDWNSHTLARGERLTGLWEREWDLPLATLYRLLDNDDNARILNRIRPGQEVEWQVDDEGYLTHLRLWTDRASGHEWIREPEGWDFQRGTVENGREISHMILSAEIDGNISAALAKRSDLSRGAANALAVLLDRYLPVRTHARNGDQFTLLVELETLVGDDTPHNLRLLAFDYRGDRIEMKAARHVDGRFYTPEGESLLPPFDRRPFTGNYRISSSFNPRRRHPVTGRVAPHQGTDFAMSVGTPIQAPADGLVTRVENHPLAGRFIVIEHGQGYSTRYLHLHRTLVQPGQAVERGQRIALSGNTGRSTGPHLHYEIHVNNRPRNPMRVELPKSEALAGEDLEQFQRISEALVARLEQGERNRQVAFVPYDELTQ